MKLKKRFVCMLSACMAVFTLATVASAAFSTSVLDNPTYSYEENGVSYVEQTVSEGGTQKLFYGEYDATASNSKYEWVIHSVRSGSNTTLSTVMDIAKDYEKQTGKKVMLAANGDFFYNTGANVESYVNDGIVISKGSFATKHCIGFDNNGKVVAGRMTDVERRLMVVINGQRTFFKIDQFNREPGDNQIAVYTNPGTYNINGAGKYICATDSTNLEQYPVFGTSRRMTTGSVTNDDSFTLRSKQFAIVVKGKNAQYFYDNVKYGVEIDLVEIPAGQFAGCTWVLGGYDILVDNGVANTNCHTDNSGNANAPRTFFGVKADGTAFICVADGRGAGGAVGITVNKEAQLAKALGAKYALELDGGGSSTMIVRINDALTLRNKPSDGSMRKVSNAIMLVEKSQKSNNPTTTTKPSTTTKPTTVTTTAPTTTVPPTVTTTVPTTEPPTATTTEPTTLPTTEPTTVPTTAPPAADTDQTAPDSGKDADNGIWLIALIGGGVLIATVIIVIICVAKKRKR